jgi:hypothetical protein
MTTARWKRLAPASAASLTATLTAAGPNPGATATDALSGTGVVRFLYWVDTAVDSVPGFPAGQVDKAGLDGSNPHNLVINQNEPTGVATGSGHVYWTTLDGIIGEANLDGSGAHAIVTGQAASGLAVDSSHLYWTNFGSPQNPAGSVWEAGLNGTGAHAIVTGQPEEMGQIAVGASHVYWAASTNFSDGSGAIWEANLDGSRPHALFGGQDGPAGITVGP